MWNCDGSHGKYHTRTYKMDNLRGVYFEYFKDTWSAYIGVGLWYVCIWKIVVVVNGIWTQTYFDSWAPGGIQL